MENTAATTATEIDTEFPHCKRDRGWGQRRHAARDSKGRFVRKVDIDECIWDCGFETDEAGVSHAHTACGDITGATTHTEDHGWACTTCIFVGPSVVDMIVTHAPTGGFMVCDTCDERKHVRKFPTVNEGGMQWRGETCRACGGGGHKVEAA